MSFQASFLVILTRDIAVTIVARIVKMSKIVLTVMTHAPWSLTVTGNNGGLKSSEAEDMKSLFAES